MRNLLLLEAANNFDDYRAARFVIAPEHSRAVGANDVAFDDWFYPFARNDRIHVRAHHNWFSIRNTAGETRDHIAAIAADLFTGVVDFNLRAHFFAILLDPLGDVAFLARMTIDLN